MALLRRVATVGGYTMISRVLGFAREILTASALGAGATSDAFFVALRLPNLFRTLFAEGAFSAAFVPLFSGMIAKDGHDPAMRFAQDTFSALLVALTGFLILGEIFTPAILHVVAPGFDADPEHFRLTVELTRITFPYLAFISLASFQGGLLNAVDRFAATAATSILLNLFLIAALLHHPVSGQSLSWAVTFAGIAQCLWLSWSCRRAGLRLSWPRPHVSPELRRLMRIMLPGVFGAGATQLNLMVSTAIASLAPVGSVSYLAYADRLNQLPLGVVGIAVATAILPTLSRHIRKGEDSAALHTQNRGLELALLLTLPAAVALMLESHAILHVLFQRGKFGAHQVAEVAPTLSAYAFGLPAFVLIKVVVTDFLARQDTLTPVKIAASAMALNIVLTVSLGLYSGLAHVGIALATSIAGWANALGLMALSARRGQFSLDTRSRRSLPRILLAAIGMGAALIFVQGALQPMLNAAHLPMRLIALSSLVGSGVAVFGLLCLILGVARPRELKRMLVRR
ncbi:MAG TPA: murein biosynthesis integral membrane protein MurJ [Acidisoma sp.]|uniref:murein biosynthesis integral membrane protein MurJ n=1 Tax=Acidisoma sp. TaxID=1872115 RepID=UPI002C2C8481|nr:murein biosynthesis integral membrane protein MurJ [Acidisoma sp.]HTI03598.1 murein biosynthesis integral membrane protein MurJ [Acidisoma sp.]